MDKKYNKMSGQLCLREGCEYDVVMKFYGATEENAKDFIYDENIFYEITIPVSGEVIPIEIDISDYNSIGIKAIYANQVTLSRGNEALVADACLIE